MLRTDGPREHYLAADAKVQPQATDQDIVRLDGATSESDVDVAQYIPPKSSITSDVEAPCFTPTTTSNAPSENRMTTLQHQAMEDRKGCKNTLIRRISCG